jgi:hypothetical protein
MNITKRKYIDLNSKLYGLIIKLHYYKITHCKIRSKNVTKFEGRSYQ